MNEWQAVELRQKVLEADRIAHEQQLGLKWEAPEQLESPIIQTANVEGDGGEGKDGGAVEARMSASDTAAKVFSGTCDGVWVVFCVLWMLCVCVCACLLFGFCLFVCFSVGWFLWF